MANKDNPRGFWPVRNHSGGEIRCNEYQMTASKTVYKGDLVKIVAAGTVEAAAADIGTACIGVAAEYKVSAATGTYLLKVYDDPRTVFGVQADSGTAVTIADKGNTANHVAGSGSATTKMSGHELDSSDIDTGAQLKIIGKVERPDNTWAEHVDLEVLINEHHYSAAVAKV
jgi:hypothetical protein